MNKQGVMIKMSNHIPGFGRGICLLLILFMALNGAAAQQTAPAAGYGSPYGIFLLTANDVVIPAGAADKNSGFLIERRREQGGVWQRAGLVAGPATLKEFENRLRQWCNRFPEWADYDRIPAGELFKALEKTGTVDSLRFYGQLLPVRLAAGSLWLDSTITDTLSYLYRVSRVLPGNEPKEMFISAPVRKESLIFLGNPVVTRHIVTDEEVIINCALDPGFRPAFYRVFRKPGGEDSFAAIRPSVVHYILNDTSFVTIQDTAVVPGRIYDYRIVPVDYYGRESVLVAMLRTGIYSFGALMAPREITTSPRLPAGGTEIRWRFDDPALIRSLHLYRSADYDTGYVLLSKISPHDTLFTDGTAEPMKKYYYYFVMEGFFNELSPPGVRFFGLAENKIPPIRPVISAVEDIANGASMKISVFNPDIRNVRLYRMIGNGGDFLPVATLPVPDEGSVVFSDTGSYFTGYTMLSYTAVAENTSYALSDFSDTVTVFPLSDVEVASPAYLTAEYENGAVNLLWDDLAGTNPEIIGYMLYRRVAEPGGSQELPYALVMDGFLHPEVNHFSDTLVVPGSRYEYMVKSVDNSNRESTGGASVLISVGRPVLLPPSLLMVSPDSDAVVLEWEAPGQEGIVSYRVYRYERGLKPVLLASLPADSDSYSDTSTQPGKLYFYYLTSVGADGTESAPGEETGIWR